MFSDPQTVTIASVAKALPKIGSDLLSSTYKLTDSANVTHTLVMSHAYAKRNRVVARYTRSLFAVDPLVPANSVLANATVTLTIDFPLSGMTNAEICDQANALVAYLSSTNIGKLVGGET